MDNSYNDLYSQKEDWQSLSTPILKEETPDENLGNPEEIRPEKEKRHSKFPVLTFQLTVSLLVLLLLFIIKFASEPLFTKIITWYEAEISRSVIYNGDFESLDFSALISTLDEA